jgi:hypothetical protein
VPSSEDFETTTKVSAKLGGAVVLKTARIFPAAHTGNALHIVAGSSVGPASRLAIAHYPDRAGFYLFHCDESWSVLADTWHESVEDAEAQAEFEYAGSSNAWVAAQVGR